MKHIDRHLKQYNDRQIKTEQDQYKENHKQQDQDCDLNIGDLVQFRKKEFTRVQIIGKILSISNNTIHVKTYVSFGGVDEFFLKIKEVRKYDTASYKCIDQKNRNNQ